MIFGGSSGSAAVYSQFHIVHTEPWNSYEGCCTNIWVGGSYILGMILTALQLLEYCIRYC